MRKLIPLIGFLFVSSIAMAAQAGFTPPASWKEIPGPDSGVVSYQTAEEKADSLLIVVRPIRAGEQTPMQWAQDEIAAVEKQGFKLLEPPMETTLGSTPFVRMVTTNNLASFALRNEQYFTSNPSKKGLLEVAILGPEGFFEAQRANIQQFLASLQ